jgi:hypothetical protein
MEDDHEKMPNGVMEKPLPLDPNASTKPQLIKLMETIQQQVTELQNYLTESEQPDPTFLGTQPPTKWTDAIDDTRSEALHNIIELQELLMTPKELLHSQSVNHSSLSPSIVLTPPSQPTSHPANSSTATASSVSSPFPAA